MTSEEIWQKFCEQFDQALWDCVDNGTTHRLTIGVDGKNVAVVDVYPQGGTMKKFDEIVLNAVKAKTGIDVAKG